MHTARLMPLPLTVSCFSKIQIGFTFLVPADPGSSGQRVVKRVCVCVCVAMVAQQAGRHRVLVDHQCRPCSNLHLLCCPNGLVSFRSFLLLASEVSSASEVTTLWRYSAFVGACLTRRGPTETYAPLAPHTHMTIMTRVCVCVCPVCSSVQRGVCSAARTLSAGTGRS